MDEIRIFIGSPDDVHNERKIIENTINEFNKMYDGFNFPKFRLINLNRDVRPDIGDFDAQTTIDKQIEGKYNVFIGILWKKFGSPTQNYDSGTEQEFENAYALKLKNPDSMKILFYFSNINYNSHKIDPDQLNKVLKFKEKIGKKGYYKEYEDLDTFKEIIENDLKTLVIEEFNSEKISSPKNSNQKIESLIKLKDVLNNFLKEINQDPLIINVPPAYNEYVIKGYENVNEFMKTGDYYNLDNEIRDVLEPIFGSISEKIDNDKGSHPIIIYKNSAYISPKEISKIENLYEKISKMIENEKQ